MAVTENPQLATDEKLIESSALEIALEEREKRKSAKKAVTKQFKEADDHAKALIGEFDLQDGEVARVGDFRITKRAIQGRTVAFETNPASRLQITLVVKPEDVAE